MSPSLFFSLSPSSIPLYTHALVLARCLALCASFDVSELHARFLTLLSEVENAPSAKEVDNMSNELVQIEAELQALL